MTKTLILTGEQIEQKITRIAYEIYENNYTEKEIIIAGIIVLIFDIIFRIVSRHKFKHKD